MSNSECWNPVLETLRSTDVDRITPLEALSLLHRIKEQIEEN